MKYFKQSTYLFVLTCISVFSLQSCSETKKAEEKETTEAEEKKSAFYTTEDFKIVEKIDVHVHIRTEDPSFVEQATADNFRLLTLAVNSSSIEIEEKTAKKYPNRVSFASSFSVENWNDPAWQQQTLSHLKNSFDKGAIGVKVWKNIGMELKDKNGKFVMIDDTRFDTVFKLMAANKIPLLSHQGEPKNCWMPIDQMTVVGDQTYFKEHPQYHMYLHPEYPSYDDQINARDHMVEKNPDLTVVSVHLASLEWNVDEIAKRLDKYPNLAVDMAARIPHLFNQATTDWQKVHDFMVKYQDRILYATDMVINKEENPADVKKGTHDTWLQDWKFFATDETLINPNNQKEFKGLQLPKEVVNKIYRENAEKWIPGLTKQS